MYCPFSKYNDGQFRSCHDGSCMAYNKENKTCKLIERISAPTYIPYVPDSPPYDNWWKYPSVTW